MNDTHKNSSDTYIMLDRSKLANLDELTRLRIQNQLLNTRMGGVLSEQPDPERFQSVLDVGCGTGNWLIDTARAYPSITRLVGIDINQKMITYAQEQAREQHVEDRVSFQMADALHGLRFSALSFDLVNQRLGMSWARQWDWKNLLGEYCRVCKVDGVIRITEGETCRTDNHAFNRINQLLVRAFYNAGNFFADAPDGVTSRLADLLSQNAGFFERDVHTQSYSFLFRSGTPDGDYYFEDMRLAVRSLKPFISKWVRFSDDYEALYQQMLQEMHQPDFAATWRYLTAWGVKKKHYD